MKNMVYYQSCRRERKAKAKLKSRLKKLKKSFEKPLDKPATKWYNKQAVDRKVTANRSLKIEQQ